MPVNEHNDIMNMLSPVIARKCLMWLVLNGALKQDAGMHRNMYRFPTEHTSYIALRQCLKCGESEFEFSMCRLIERSLEQKTTVCTICIGIFGIADSGLSTRHSWFLTAYLTSSPSTWRGIAKIMYFDLYTHPESYLTCVFDMYKYGFLMQF
jgi:hypothetical protein